MGSSTSNGAGPLPPEDRLGFAELVEEVGRITPLKPGEREHLLARLRQDPKARARLVESQLATVLNMAMDCADQGLDPGDLFQEGCEGLAEAVEGFTGPAADFDETVRDAVARHMEGALSKERDARENNRRVIEEAEDYERVELELAHELKRQPSVEEMAAKLEWTSEQVTNMGDLVRQARRRHDEELVEFLDPLDDSISPEADD